MNLSRRWSASVLALCLGAGLLVALPGAAAYAVDPVAGAQTSGDVLFPNVGNGGYDVQHYDIDLAWTPGQTLDAATIRATTTIEAVTTGAPLSSYSLDMEGLTVESVTVGGRPATFSRIEDVGAIKHKLVVTPATPVSGAFTTTVTYSGVPRSHEDADGSLEGWNVTSDGATFLNQPVGAMTGFPSNNTPADKATYTLALDVPTTITNAAGAGAAAAVSNGELVSREPGFDGTRTTWTWDQREQMATSLVLISIGKYDVLRSSVTLSDGRVIPEWSFVDSALSPTAKTTINTRRGAIETITRGLESIYGPYPGNSTGLVVDTVPGGISYALETQDRSFFPGSVGFNTLIHELAHQWYGDAVSPTVWNDIWINEGMGTWAPAYYNNEIASPPTSANTTESTFFSSWSRAADGDYATPPGGMTDSADLYGYQTYTRSGQMWEALRTAIGDPSFFTFLKQWQARYDGQSRGGADFEALAEEISGRDLTAFFQDWIYDADKPAWPAKFDLALASEPADGELAPASSVTYTLSSTNTGRVVQDGSLVTVDLADVLDDAAIDPATLPASMTLDGSTLTWAVPSTALAATTAESFTVVVDAAATEAALVATVLDTTLGSTCTTCTSTLSVPAQPLTSSADPTVTGTPVVGATLSAATPGWDAGTSFAYRWLSGATPIAGATGATYVVTPADLGAALSVQVTGTRPRYAALSRTSPATGPVGPGVQPVVRSGAGLRTKGVTRPGRTLRVKVPGLVAGSAVTYTWKVAGDQVRSSGSPRLVVRPRFVGSRVRVVVRATAPGYAPVKLRVGFGRVA